MSQPLPDELARAQQLHDCAMDHAEDAALCQIRSDRSGFLSATQNALHCEMQAASIIQPYLDFEPSRSVVLRSAAALALDLKEWRTAERQFKQRADAAERLFLRTAERQLGLPYREDSYISASYALPSVTGL